MKNQLNRREFLKLSGALLLGLAAQRTFPALADAFAPQELAPAPKPLGRVISWSAQAVRQSPSAKSELVKWLSHDTVIPLLATTVGEAPWPTNPIWYLTEEGFVHSGHIQPVERAIQTTFPTVVNPPGFWVEACVPYAEARWKPGSSAVARKLYYETVYRVVAAVQDEAGAWWYQLQEGITWSPGPYVLAETVRHITPLDVAPISPGRTDKWIEIKLSEQRLTCYEDTTPVFTTPLASGTARTPTPRGEFKILYKRHTQRMIGDDYDLAGVPFPTYFTPSGVAIHGTYWHNDYGRQYSHGCLNVPSQAARWVFRWTDPIVPYSEHTLVTGAAAGTRVVVLY